MLVDLSHVSPDTMNDALDVAEAPVLFSHSSARSGHRRPAQRARRGSQPAAGKWLRVVMVAFVPFFVTKEEPRFVRAAHAGRRTEPAGCGRTARNGGLERTRRPPTTLADVADHIDHIRDVAGIEPRRSGVRFRWNAQPSDRPRWTRRRLQSIPVSPPSWCGAATATPT